MLAAASGRLRWALLLTIVATDAGTEGTFLLGIDTKTGKTMHRYAELALEYMLSETEGHSLSNPQTAAELSARTLRFLGASLAITP